MTKEISETEARQAEPRHGVRIVLMVSTGLAVLAMIGAYIFVY